MVSPASALSTSVSLSRSSKEAMASDRSLPQMTKPQSRLQGVGYTAACHVYGLNCQLPSCTPDSAQPGQPIQGTHAELMA